MLNSLKLENINPLLINLTGVRLLILFALLLEKPRTAEEINEYFRENNYPNENFSIDTLRNDIKALRQAGCEISRADKSKNYSYTLISHPFGLKLDIELSKAISKAYNRIYKYLSIKDLMDIELLLNKLADFTENEETKEFLYGISILKKIDKTILKDLIKSQNIKNKITFTYKSPNTGKQEVEFLVEDFEFRSRKLYITGFNYTQQQNSFLLVSKICSPINFCIKPEKVENDIQTVIYELSNTAKQNYQEQENEKIIDKTQDKITIEFKSNNNFKLKQKILAYGFNCKVISPQIVKEQIKEELQKMSEVY